MARLIPLSHIDHAAVEALLDAAFGADRHARTAYRMRDGVTALDALSFAAVDGEHLLGTIQCWPVALITAEARHPLILVGPVAVAPDAQGKGVGKALMQIMLAAADAEDKDALIMIGDPDYYGRFFQFYAAATAGWDVPGPVERNRLLARIADGISLPTHGSIVPDLFFGEALHSTA
jgi:predicted N-acetyltransferase YhbS